MSVKQKRGRRRVIWWIVIFGVIAALLSKRSERNFFADAWGLVMPADDQNEPAADIKPEPAPVRKCDVEDGTLYSNEGCDLVRPDGQGAELPDSSGVDQPQVSLPLPLDAHDTLPDKAREKALSH